MTGLQICKATKLQCIGCQPGACGSRIEAAKLLDALIAYQVQERENERAESGITPDELESFVRCEDCIHGGWTDDVQTHCNKWHTHDDPMCVGYLGFCGAGEKGEMLEVKEMEAVAALNERKELSKDE